MSVATLLAAAGCPASREVPLGAGVVRVGDVVVKVGGGARAVREAEGLQVLAAAGVRVPEVLHVGPEGLVMRWLAPGPDEPEALGRMIATLHRSTRGQGAYGWPRSVFLGDFALPAGEGDWGHVFGTLRLAPLVRATWGVLGPLGPRLEAWRARAAWPEEGPCLVHGDLWAGNALATAEGPALIDPGIQRAERGLDLAMMELFGGFGGRCRAAYEAVWPVPEAVQAALPGYQLYFLLLHVHAFGRGYLPQVAEALERVSRGGPRA